MQILTSCMPKWQNMGKPAKDAVMKALEMLTGCWSLPTVTHVCHLDKGKPCCGSRQEAMNKTVDAFLGLLFHCMVGTPCEVRWLSFVDSVGFWGQGVLIHNVIPRAWGTAFPKIVQRFNEKQAREARGREQGPRELGGRGRGNSLCFTTFLRAVAP